MTTKNTMVPVTAPEKLEREKSALFNVPVLLEFFNRPDSFSQVFSVIKQVRPSVLFLYQDGIRAGRGDEAGHRACRDIAENIDWSCTVYRWYQSENQGCDPSGFLAQKWAFSHVDRCIVLEDDCVPALAFFPYCEELLERYKDDERINYICGMNNLGKWKPESASYFFGRRGSIWGWASWSRVVLDRYDDYRWFSEPYLKQLEKIWKPCHGWKQVAKRFRYCASTGKEYFEVLGCERQLRRDALNIIPAENMIKNVGCIGGTHSDVELKMYPRFYRKWMEMDVKNIEFPLRHPETVIQDVEYDRKMDPTDMQQVLLRLERIFLQLRYGRGDVLWEKFKRKCFKAFKRG